MVQTSNFDQKGFLFYLRKELTLLEYDATL